MDFNWLDMDAAICVACNGHHLLPAIGGHPDQLLLDALVQPRQQGPVLALQCPENTSLLIVLLVSSSLELKLEGIVLLQDEAAPVVSGEDILASG